MVEDKDREFEISKQEYDMLKEAHLIVKQIQNIIVNDSKNRISLIDTMSKLIAVLGLCEIKNNTEE